MNNHLDTFQKQPEAKPQLEGQILDHMAGGVSLVRVRDATFAYTNHKFEEMFGYEPGEMIDRPVHIVNAPGDKSPEETAQKIVDSLHKHGHWQGQVRNIKKDGTLFWSHAIVSTFEHSRYGPVWVVIQIDITEQKRIEQELAQKNRAIRLVQEIAVLINETSNVESVLRSTVDRICTHTGWPVGHIYRPAGDGNQEIVPTSIWRLDYPRQLNSFKNKTMETEFEPGEGLVGHVFDRAEPIWITDVSEDVNFTRAAAAGKVGLKAGFALPVLSGNNVVAILEFFTDKAIPPDETLLEAMEQVGTQLGRAFERQRAEEALKESEANLRKAQRIAHLGSWEMEIATGESKWSDEFFRICGFEPQAFKPTAAVGFNLIHPDDREVAGQAVTDAIERNEEYRIEKRIIRSDGTVRHVLSQGELVTDEQGTPLKLTGTFLDITGQKEVQEQLRQERDLLDRLLVTSPVGITMVDAEGRIIYANPQAEELLGLTKDEITQRSYNAPAWKITDLDGNPFPPEQLPFVQVKASKQPVYNVQHATEWPNGERVLLSINAAPLLTKEGQFDGMVAAIEDITEQVQAQKQLKRYALKLQQSNAELEQFAYIASHDLQEPLRMISSYLQLLQRRYQGKLDSDADEFIEFAVDGARRMSQLIQDLLHYSRVGTQAKSLAPVDCRAVLDRVRKSLQIKIEETGASLPADPLPVVHGDAVQLEQLFQNLVNNAIKFRGAAPPEIHIRAAQQGEMWRFAVQDNGLGFDPAAAEDIFTIFRRLHSREAYSGTGLGLAICKKIVERHGGQIWAESEPGSGSTFFFTLPAAKMTTDDNQERR